MIQKSQINSDFQTLPLKSKLSKVTAHNQHESISSRCSQHESLSERILRVQLDFRDLSRFYPILTSPTRQLKLTNFLGEELSSLQSVSFSLLAQDGKIDYILLRNFLVKTMNQIDLDAFRDYMMKPLIPFASIVTNLCEDQQVQKFEEPKALANWVDKISISIAEVKGKIKEKSIKVAKNHAYRAARTIDDFRQHLAHWFNFFRDYDPMFTWWVTTPYEKMIKDMESLSVMIREEIVGISPEDSDVIIGEPIGREGLLLDLEAEMIPYSPEELIEIGESEYRWCEEEMKKAAQELSHNNWHAALEHVKNLYVEPGKQPELIRFLADEAAAYVKKHDLVTVPSICEETWRMFMMSPARQKVNPFFLGGTSMIVSYPTSAMAHEDKMMSMRGNNIHFSRSTVFHEMVPGHHLQFHMIARFKPYRQVFDTPFWMEGWSLYFEFLFWDRGFAETAENKIGMLFWRMHRCLRIIFSIKFHLGELTPQECVDMLVERGGHERVTAEGEVRRSFNGDYTPLYQAGYMLGALQLMQLRKEVLAQGDISEKEFHDRVMRENEMPIEMLRALILEQEVEKDFKSSWRFYNEESK